MQVKILCSCVTTNNNYFHRGVRPNYYIQSSDNGDKSVVTLQNDMFIQILSSDETESYDIRIDKYTSLKISNVYRYDATSIDFGKMCAFGINIQKADESSLKEFNDYSYIASKNSEIGSNYSVFLNHTIKDVNSPHIYAVMESGIGWYLGGGTYQYYYQIIWDDERGIKKTSSDRTQCVFPIQWYITETDRPNSKLIPENSTGVLLSMTEDINANCSMVRLIREKVLNNEDDNIIQFVDVPVCGSRSLYDNGISVCGYKWSSIQETDNDKPSINEVLNEISDKNMEMLRIIDGNVECFTKRADGITPTSGWKLGDVIHNIGSNITTYVDPDNIE